ncbi:MAG TPA: glycoside hydrolase family 38 C-terminal domain-containing protein [Gaiellaceae bacterium]|nr:glycoside hydrolase family 38 C-terminal domain-containing protein [Gaiellaceae bacterium]
MSERLLHMVGNAHIDPVWLWQWPEGYQEVRATFQSALDRMEEYPDFVFTCDSVVFFEWVEETAPELFEQIKARIAEGRWQVIGGWWLEPDCNIPGGESYVRHALYGQRYLQDRFGITATTGGNLDSFGHNATIPQLLAKSGMDSYVFLRPGPHERTLPGPIFWWESPDGSRVLAYRIPHEYCSPGADLGHHVDKSLAQLPPEPPELMVFYGVGNHGGGPTKANIDSIARLNATGGLPRMELSSPRAFFDRVRGGDWPTWRGELQHHGVGCYSAHSGIKRWNRRAENLLQRAEKWSAVADAVAGQAYPLEKLTEAWKLLLFNQFHDTIAGTSIAPAYEDARDQIGHASSLAALAFNRAVQSVARRIDIPHEQGMTPVVVFNPHPWELRADVELEFVGFPNAESQLHDDEGTPVPVQRTLPLTTMNGSRGRLVFPAVVPPLGYRVYRLTEGVPAGTPVAASDTTLENEHLLLEIDKRTGRIARLVVKEADADVADRRARHAVVVDDRSDTWGHRVKAYDEVRGEFEVRSVRLVEEGPVRATIRVDSAWNDSTLVEHYTLGRDARHVDVQVSLDWRERLRLLKLRYGTTAGADTATYEIAYGHVERPANGDEESAQTWVDVSADGRGLSVCTDAKVGHDVRGGSIGVTVVRSPVWAWHEPRQLDPDATYEYMDQGRQDFRVRLVPHAGDWRAAETVRRAAELNQPPFALLESYHGGDLPQRASYGSVDAPNVVLAVVKHAEDGDGSLVVRAYETAGREAHARFELLGRTWEADFGPAEIKTFRLRRDPDSEVAETNLLEW